MICHEKNTIKFYLESPHSALSMSMFHRRACVTTMTIYLKNDRRCFRIYLTGYIMSHLLLLLLLLLKYCLGRR